MLIAILRGTPPAVWALLAGLVALGLSQVRARTLPSTRAVVLPLLFVALSIGGVASGFGAHAAPLAAWLIGAGTAFVLAPRVLPAPRAAWSVDRRSVRVEGSWLPLLLIVGVFALKYAAGVSLAMHPELASQTAFATSFSAAYGVFGGIFAGRARQLWLSRRAA